MRRIVSIVDGRVEFSSEVGIWCRQVRPQSDRAGIVHLLARCLQRGLVVVLQRCPRIVYRTLQFIEVFVCSRPPLLHGGTGERRWWQRGFGFGPVNDDNAENSGQYDRGDNACRDYDPQFAV